MVFFRLTRYDVTVSSSGVRDEMATAAGLETPHKDIPYKSGLMKDRVLEMLR